MAGVYPAGAEAVLTVAQRLLIGSTTGPGA
jgi:hypothetical protein